MAKRRCELIGWRTIFLHNFQYEQYKADEYITSREPGY